MDLAQLIQFFAGAFVSELVGTIGGFGSATLFTAFASLFINLKTAIALIAAFHLSGALVRLAYFFKDIHWRVLGFFIVPDVIFTIVAANVVVSISNEAIRLVFGIFLVVYSFFALFAPRLAALPKNRLALFLGGAASGFLAGLLGTGGAVRAMAMQAFKLPKRAYLGTSAAMAVVTDFVRIPIYGLTGVIVYGRDTLFLTAGLVAIGVVGALIGSRLAEKISERIFRTAVHVLLLFAGIYFIFL